MKTGGKMLLNSFFFSFIFFAPPLSNEGELIFGFQKVLFPLFPQREPAESSVLYPPCVVCGTCYLSNE